MKLIRLKITDPNGFRSLQKNFEINFLHPRDYSKMNSFNPYVLAGPNGSGKSNLLEALATIFYHLECMYLNNRPESFEYEESTNPNGFKSEKASPNGFELEYYISAPVTLNIIGENRNAHIKIIKECNQSPIIYWDNRNLFDIEAEKKLSSIEARSILPDFVLGYSSGENEILSLPFFKMRFIHFDEYMDNLIQQVLYNNVPESRLTFLNNEYSQAIILTNLLMQDNELLKPFKDEVGVEDLREFRIILKKYVYLDKSQIAEFIKEDDISQTSIIESDDDEMGETRYRINVIQNMQTITDKLKKCSTCNYYDIESDEWYFDYWINDETKVSFMQYFDSAIELFQTFQILLTLNLYTVSRKLKKDLYQSNSLYVNETVPTLPSDERIMRFKDMWIDKDGLSDGMLLKSLSDGEHQFLHSLGLCLLYKNKKCLFLLDEPETHFNPDWRSKFISSIHKCFKDDEANSTIREMLITTHTPFLISDSKKEHVLVFHKDIHSKSVSVTRPNYNTLGASINKVTMKTFGKTETIGGYAEKKLNEIKRRFINGEDKQELLDEVNNLLGDSVEKVLFINQVLTAMEEK